MANRVLLGRDNSGVYGFKVSKSGINVLTAGAADFLIDSSKAHFRVLQEGQLAFTTSGLSAGPVTIVGAGSSPLFFIVRELVSATLWAPYYNHTLDNPGTGPVDPTNYQIIYSSGSISATRDTAYSDTAAANAAVTLRYSVLAL